MFVKSFKAYICTKGHNVLISFYILTWTIFFFKLEKEKKIAKPLTQLFLPTFSIYLQQDFFFFFNSGDTLETCWDSSCYFTSCQHGGENDPTRPDIGRLSFVLCLTEKLWSHVRQSPAQTIQESLVSLVTKHGGQAEVCQLQVIYEEIKKQNIIKISKKAQQDFSNKVADMKISLTFVIQ